MPESGVKQPYADAGDFDSHLKQSPLAVHGIWPKVIEQRAKLVPLAARVNLSLTDPKAVWTAKDVSASVSSKAAWILVNRVIADARYAQFSCRPYGSTADPLAAMNDVDNFTNPGSRSMRFDKSDLVWVPLDYTTKKFEYKCDTETKATYYLIAYLEQAQ